MDPASDEGVYACVFWSLRPGSHSPDQTLLGHQALVLLLISSEVLVLFPPTMTSLMARTCCSSPLSLTTPDPTCVWQTSLAKNTVLQQTD